MSSASDFDFLIGDWNIANEKLVERFAGSSEWQHFDASTSCRKILNGAGNLDEMTLPGSDFVGLSLRVFNPVDGQWSIHWVDNDRHRVLEPMVGRFEGGVGLFYGGEEHAGRAVLARFRWNASTDSPRWEQAFSDDGGETWETNWVMNFSPRR
ncbi:hypothetical protein [Arvimicrobium flavum]|uniref:hypothetical protein n=1 Tax=Arvimicrobium flavum TaxID=3393320 RepID=UPI00237A1642|nr:hypothetical protein [Mesorhizobium shangrilense]